MPSSYLQFARAGACGACLILFLTSLPTHAASAGSGCGTAVPGVAASPPGGGSECDLRADLWRLASGDPTRKFPFDPATFVGPPVPLAILYAPAPTMAPLTAGMRAEIEPGAGPLPARAMAPPAEKITRYSEVFSKLTPVRRSDGSLYIDLTGVYMSDIEAWIDADGVHLSEDGTPAAPPVR